jgi:glutathione S-transferase
MLLHDLSTGMNTRRVRIFLAEKGITVPIQKVDSAAGENTAPEFLKLNPLGKLPVLQLDDGTVLTESIAICRYFEALHPNPPLFGSTPLEQAQVEMWTRRMEFELTRPITDVFMHGSEYFRTRIKQLPDYAQWSRPMAQGAMQWLNSELAAREYVAGASYSMADIVAQCALVLGKAVGLRADPELAHLNRWWAAVTARPTARA